MSNILCLVFIKNLFRSGLIPFSFLLRLFFSSLFRLIIASFVLVLCVFYCLILPFSCFLPTCFLFFLLYFCALWDVNTWLYVLYIIMCLYIIVRFLGYSRSNSIASCYFSCAISWLLGCSFFSLFVLQCLLL